MEIKFNNTQEALKFGITATPEQIEFLRERMGKTQEHAMRLIDDGDLDAASLVAFRAQLDRESITAIQILAEHPEFARLLA